MNSGEDFTEEMTLDLALEGLTEILPGIEDIKGIAGRENSTYSDVDA